MRTLRRVSIAGGLTLLATLAFAGTGQAAQEGNQTFIEEECAPAALPPVGATPAGCPGASTKAPKKKGSPLSVHIRTEVSTGPSSAGGLGPKATTAVIRFPQEKKFALGFVPFCTAPLAGTTSEQAASPPPTGCSTSLIGRGRAVVALPLGPGGAPVEVEGQVLVFVLDGNTILLHVRFDALGSTTLLEADLAPSTVPGFGTQAIVHEQGSATLPTVGGGVGQFKSVDVQIFKKKKKKTSSGSGAYASKKKKKVLSVIKGTCKGDRTWTSQAEFTYADQAPITVTETQPCTPKK